MKGSPMQRNFGIGSPLHQNEEETRKERRKRQRTERKDLRLDQRIERLESKKSKKKETVQPIEDDVTERSNFGEAVITKGSTKETKKKKGTYKPTIYKA